MKSKESMEGKQPPGDDFGAKKGGDESEELSRQPVPEGEEEVMADEKPLYRNDEEYFKKLEKIPPGTTARVLFYLTNAIRFLERERDTGAPTYQEENLRRLLLEEAFLKNLCDKGFGLDDTTEEANLLMDQYAREPGVDMFNTARSVYKRLRAEQRSEQERKKMDTDLESE